MWVMITVIFSVIAASAFNPEPSLPDLPDKIVHKQLFYFGYLRPISCGPILSSTPLSSFLFFPNVGLIDVCHHVQIRLSICSFMELLEKGSCSVDQSNLEPSAIPVLFSEVLMLQVCALMPCLSWTFEMQRF